MSFQNPQVAFLNESTVLTDASVDLIRRGCSYQVHNDFGPRWHTGARTISIPSGQNPPPGAWQVILKDDSDVQGALGYHDLSSGVPIAYVFARTCENNGVQPSSCASHELLEMLGDPFIDRCAQVGSSTFFSYEACDAVEQSEYQVTIADASGIQHPVVVSDFVFPNWWDKGSSGPWDFTGKLTAPLQLEPGGSYIGKWTPSTGWTSINAEGITATHPDPDDVKRCIRPYQRPKG